MSVEGLRELIAKKQIEFNQVLRDNQSLVSQTRRLEKDLAQSNGEVESLKKKLKVALADVVSVVAEREVAKKLAASLYEKLTYLSGRTDIKAKDLKKVISLYHAALESVTRITAWPELGEWDFFEQCFSEAERKILGSKTSSPQALNRDRLQAFIQRSMSKRLKYFKDAMNTPEKMEEVRRTIEEFLLELPKAAVLPGYRVTNVRTDDPDSYVLNIEITDAAWIEALRNK
jgi:chromosome segregation ATPase